MIAPTPREPSLGPETPRALRFGDYSLDRATGELTRRGVAVKIPPQPARALQHLVENAGRLVTRRELQEVLWGDGRHVDFEQGLNYCIRQVREALGDSAETSRHLVTVPRRGYRFVAAVQPAAGPDGSGRALAKQGQRWWVPALVVLPVVAAAAAWVAWRGGPERPSSPLRLAVAPFAALAPEDATRARVLYEELIVDLEQQHPGVEVVASAVAAADVRLVGSLGRGDEELTLALLLRARDGDAVWSATFRQPLAAEDWLDWPQQAAEQLAAASALSPPPSR